MATSNLNGQMKMDRAWHAMPLHCYYLKSFLYRDINPPLRGIFRLWQTARKFTTFLPGIYFCWRFDCARFNFPLKLSEFSFNGHNSNRKSTAPHPDSIVNVHFSFGSGYWHIVSDLLFRVSFCRKVWHLTGKFLFLCQCAKTRF